MERTRKQFLVAASAAGLALTGTGAAQAQTPSPSPKPTSAPSALADAFAQRMRAFDAQLTPKQIDDIARQIDQGFDVRKALRPKGHGLRNGDAPSPQFEVAE